MLQAFARLVSFAQISYFSIEPYAAIVISFLLSFLLFGFYSVSQKTSQTFSTVT